jgi:hypothetical protein
MHHFVLQKKKKKTPFLLHSEKYTYIFSIKFGAALSGIARYNLFYP